MPPYLPQVRKQRSSQCAREVGNAARTPSPALYPNGSLYHLDVPVPPLLQTFVEIHEPLAELRVLRIAAIDVDENLLNLG